MINPLLKSLPALSVIADLKRHQWRFVTKHPVRSRFKFKTITRPDDNKNTRGLSISCQYITYFNYSGHPIPPDSQQNRYRKTSMIPRLQDKMWVRIESVSYHHVITGIVTWRTFFPADLMKSAIFFLLMLLFFSACMTYLVFNGKEEVRVLFSFLLFLKNKHFERARRKVFRMSRGFCCLDCSSLHLSFKGSYVRTSVRKDLCVGRTVLSRSGVLCCRVKEERRNSIFPLL